MDMPDCSNSPGDRPRWILVYPTSCKFSFQESLDTPETQPLAQASHESQSDQHNNATEVPVPDSGSVRYRPDFVPHPEVVRGLNSCIVRFEPNNARRVSASKQISDFGSAKADFGTDLAISTRTELNPGRDWSSMDWIGAQNVARNAIINAAELASYDQVKQTILKIPGSQIMSSLIYYLA